MRSSSILTAGPAFFALALFCLPVEAQTTMDALNRAESAYRAMETLRADFTQTLENRMLGGSLVSRGTIFLAPPSRFAMHFTDPSGDRIVSDGTWLWIYAPSSVPNQVIKQPIPSRGAASPNLLAQFVVRPLEHYRADYIGAADVGGQTADRIRLIPRRDDETFTEAEIVVARTTGLILQLVVLEPAGQRRTIEFDQIETDVEIPPSELQFAVPDGTRVIVP